MNGAERMLGRGAGSVLGRPYIGWLLALGLAMAVAGCGGAGGGEGGGGDFDTAGATAAVEQGKADLEALLEAQPESNAIYDPLSGVGVSFDTADALDPTLEEGNFWSGIFEFLTFLNSEETAAFLVKLGWGDGVSPFGASGGEFVNFIERLGQTAGDATTADPPLHPFLLPNDPNKDLDPHPCVDPMADPQNPAETCVVDSTGWVPFNVYFVGLPSDPNPGVQLLTFAELYTFWTQTFGDSVRSAVVRLKKVGENFSTTLTAYQAADLEQQVVPPPHTVTLDKFEADVFQIVYGIFDVLTSLPQIWTWGDVDTFVSVSAQRDETTGEYLMTGGPTPTPVNEITEDELATFFRDGTDSTFNNGDEPLHGNPAGVTRLANALHDLVEAIEGVITRIAAGDSMTDHIIPMDWVFDSYTSEAAVMEYAAAAVTGTLGEFRASLLGDPTVNIFLPVGKITDFAACTPGGSGAVDDLIHNDATGLMESDPSLLASANSGFFSLGEATTDWTAGHVTHSIVAAQDAPYLGNDYYFAFTLAEARDVSIYVTGAGDTVGTVGYLGGGVRTPQIISWDTDDDSGPGINFGLSIDADYLNATDMPLLNAGPPMTLYVRVDNFSGDDFTLHVQVSDSQGVWPASEPIFLKGGGGRNFLAETYTVATGQVNLGAALATVSNIWDLSDRNSMTWIPDDPQTLGVDESRFSLLIDYPVLQNEFQKIFPASSFDNPEPPATVDLFDTANLPVTGIDPGITIPGVTDSNEPTVDGSFGTVSFCAYPDLFSTFSPVSGGRLIFPFGNLLNTAPPPAPPQ